MKYRFQSLVLVSLALLFFAGPVGPAAATELPEQTPNATSPSLSPYPGMVCGNADCSIRWDEELGLESLEDTKRVLEKKFEPPQKIWKVRYASYGTSSLLNSINLCNCKMMLHFARLKAEPEDYTDGNYNHMEYMWYQCAIIQLLEHAIPPRIDYFQDFSLNAEALNYLSPRFALETNQHEEDEQIKAENALLSWKEFIPDLRVEIIKKNETIVAGDGTHIYLTESARGDFNHDGFQDILISIGNTIDEGHWYTHFAYLITRKSSQGMTEILEMIYYGFDVNKFK